MAPGEYGRVMDEDLAGARLTSTHGWHDPYGHVDAIDNLGTFDHPASADRDLRESALKDVLGSRNTARVGFVEDAIRAGVVESLFRKVNERVRELNERLEPLVDYGSWACECADPTCLERIDLTGEEYDELRARPTHFAIAPDQKHFEPTVETVVRKTDRYWVVEKQGEAADIAIRERFDHTD